MWQEQNKKLYKKFTFSSFRESIDFANKVADIADKLDHHPTIKIDYTVVEIWSSTHEKGSVTEKDYELTQAIDDSSGKSIGGANMVADTLIDEKKSTELTDVKLFTDGGSRGNPGPSAAAYVIMNGEDNVVEKFGHYIGVTTNNQAEYQALRRGLERARELQISNMQVYMDSLLVVNQINGLYKVKNRDLWPIFENIQSLKTQFKKISFHHIPREFNKLADSEVNRILDDRHNAV